MAQMMFPLFSSFPGEIRNQIWRDAMPDKAERALYLCRKGCWCPRMLTEADEDFDPEHEELNLNYEFHHDRLDYAKFEVPLFYVSREARGVSLAWLYEQGLKIRTVESALIFLRLFNAERDTLYVSPDNWNTFLKEPYDRQSQPDLLDRNVNCPGVAFSRIAVPEALLRNETHTLLELFDWYSNLERIFVVLDAQSDLQPEAKDLDVQQRWELETRQSAAFCWNDKHRRFEWSHGKDIGSDNTHALIEEASDGLAELLTQEQKHTF